MTTGNCQKTNDIIKKCYFEIIESLCDHFFKDTYDDCLKSVSLIGRTNQKLCIKDIYCRTTYGCPFSDVLRFQVIYLFFFFSIINLKK